MQAVVFMAGFAAAWWAAGFLIAPPALPLGPLPVALGGIAVSAAMILAAWIREKGATPVSPAARRRRGRIVGWASGLEAAAIVLAVNLLTRNGLGAYVFPTVALIVGLHFLPLARLLPVPVYYVSALLLMVVAATGLAVAPALRPLVIGAGSALSLWLTCLAKIVEPVPAARR